MRLIDADALVKSIVKRLCIRSEEYLTAQESVIVSEIYNAPTIEPNLLIAPETIERGSEVFIGEDIVVVHHDDFMDMQCKAMLWDDYGEEPKEQTMIISKNRYKNLIKIIDSQKQLIEEYKRKVTLLEEQDELKSQLIRKLERLMVRRADDE